MICVDYATIQSLKDSYLLVITDPLLSVAVAHQCFLSFDPSFVHFSYLTPSNSKGKTHGSPPFVLQDSGWPLQRIITRKREKA